MTEFRKIGTFKRVDEFREYLWEIGADFDLAQKAKEGSQSAFSDPLNYQSGINGRAKRFTNRWAILPMEGWDCQPSGAPSELTERRWLRFAESGAKLIFGGEAAAVMTQGRANPRQMTIIPETVEKIAQLREKTIERHRNLFGTGDDPWIGLQLTHSGRFCRPAADNRLQPKTAYRHPVLDGRVGATGENVLTDGETEAIIERFHLAGKLALEAGFDFVDIKCAHGYLGHEFLSAVDRPGKFGGSFENRTRFFREIVAGIRRVAPALDIAVRLSLGDMAPFRKGSDGVGVPELPEETPYRWAFGGDGTGLGFDPTEPIAFLKMAESLGVRMVCATVGSPYYNPHIQRPAAFAVADGYLPPEEPLLGVSRQISILREIKSQLSNLVFLSSGLTYLQEFLPLVGEELLAHRDTDFIGIGRMALTYPRICADYLEGKPLEGKKICRTFGDCTNAPRAGLVSGCYPLDDFYRARPEASRLRELKKGG